MVLKNILIDYWRQIHTREGYVEVQTPDHPQPLAVGDVRPLGSL